VTTAETTTFYCVGSPDEVAWFLGAVAESISRPELNRIDVERGLLRAEAHGHGAGLAALHDIWRWGARGHGLAGFDEVGLRNVGTRDVQDWLSRFFTADNAGLWVTNDSLVDIELALPAGERQGPPRPGPRMTATPSYFPSNVSTVSLSAEVARGGWPGLVAWLLERRLMARLRYQEGVTYGVQTDVDTCGTDVRRIIVSLDAVPDQLAHVARVAVEVVDALVTQGPTTDELNAWSNLCKPGPREPQVVVAELSRLVYNSLMGLPRQSPHEIHQAALGLTTETVKATLADMHTTSLWCVPYGFEVPGVARVQEGNGQRLKGTNYFPPAG